MIGSIAKMVAYNKAPRTTFALLHPRQAMKLRRLRNDFRRSPAPRVAAAGAALTMAAIALPLGLWLGRRNGRNEIHVH
jgi:hypothetical protein